MSSSTSQPDHAPALQSLHNWINRNTEESHDITTGASSAKEVFVPRGLVEAYFKEDQFERTRALLEEIFPGAERRPTAQAIAEHCPRVFCILLELGKAKPKYILTFSKHISLHDERLPFDDPDKVPRDFPVSSGDQQFYKAFFKAQWKFFSPKLKSYQGTKLSDEFVLPFVHLKEQGHGHDAKVYKAKVHESHDNVSDPPSDGHVYALKTFKRTRSKSRYEREAAAFEQLTDSGSREPIGLIAFYGSFEYRDTFNIMLEFANMGSLEVFFSKADRPEDGTEIINFWESFFDTVKALFTIHERYLDQDGALLLKQGWHHDLKPANILVTRSDGRLPYSWSFKIADLGLSYFQSVMEDQTEVIGRARFGTRSYGPPECYASSDFTSNRKIDVRRSSDIWSLGCISSEVAVWVAQGPEHIAMYKKQRIAETERMGTFRDGGCFHDGQRRLNVVNTQHEKVRRSLHPRDYITGKVIERMTQEMLHHRPSTRPTADQLVGKAEDILADARQELKDAPVQDAPLTMHLPVATPTGYSESAPPVLQDQGEDKPSRGSTHAQQQFLQRSRSLHQSTDTRQLSLSELSSAPGNYQQHNLEYVGGWAGEVPLVGRPDRRHRDPDHFSAPWYPPQTPALIPEDEPPDTAPEPRHSRPKLDECSVEQAKAWYQALKSKVYAAVLPHAHYKRDLQNRDHIFMIDDSISMRPYWPAVVELLQILAYILKDCDRNGLELFFLGSGARHSNKNASPLVEITSHHLVNGTTTLERKFDAHLRAYCKEIEKSKSKNRIMATFKPLMKRSIYVFTNGVLAAGDALQGQEAIKTLVETLHDNKLPRDQIGIQFIQFGENEEGRRLLQSLDELKSTLGLALDIVDTERADGNVWKMLLGSINSLFDGDATPEPTRLVPPQSPA